MAKSKLALLAVLVAGAICLSSAIPDPTVEMNDAKDKILQSAAAATSKSRFPAGRSLLQDTADFDEAKDKVMKVAAAAMSKSRFPAGRSLLQDTAEMNDAKDKVLQAAAAATHKSRFPSGRSLLGEGKHGGFDRAASNLAVINAGSSKVADATHDIMSSIGRRNWVTRRLLDGTNKHDVDRMQLTAIKVDEEISKVTDAWDNIQINTDRVMRTQGRQLLKTKRPEIPDTATMADKINLAVYDMGFDTNVKVNNQGRHLLQGARAGELVPTTVPGPKVIYGNSEQVDSLDKNKARINDGVKTVSSLFDKIAGRAGFRV